MGPTGTTGSPGRTGGSWRAHAGEPTDQPRQRTTAHFSRATSDIANPACIEGVAEIDPQTLSFYLATVALVAGIVGTVFTWWLGLSRFKQERELRRVAIKERFLKETELVEMRRQSKAHEDEVAGLREQTKILSGHLAEAIEARKLKEKELSLRESQFRKLQEQSKVLVAQLDEMRRQTNLQEQQLAEALRAAERESVVRREQIQLQREVQAMQERKQKMDLLKDGLNLLSAGANVYSQLFGDGKDEEEDDDED